MILAFHPTQPGIPGQELPIPTNWIRFLASWSDAVFRQHDFGTTLIQEMISREFSIFIWTLKIVEPVRLYPTTIKPTIALQYMIEGNILCNLSGFGRKLIEKGNYGMFYSPVGFNDAWFEPGMYESMHIELQPAYLTQLTAIRPEIRELIFRMENSSNKGMSMALAHTNYITNNIIQNLRTCKKTGASLELELRKYILELLSEYFTDIVKNDVDDARENNHYKSLMIKIKNYILSEPNVHEHTLEKLARIFGISVTLIKKEFKIQFGISASNFVRIHALSKSYHLLTTTKKTIEEISEEVGYSWRPAFETAFKKRFNCTPSQLRRD
jgi:AraC-like DNA-binding protein